MNERFFYAGLISGFSVARAFEVAVRNVEVVFDAQRKEPLTPQPTTASSSSSASASVADSASSAKSSLPTSATAPMPLSRSFPSASVPESGKFLLLPASSSHSQCLFTRRYPRVSGMQRVSSGSGCSSPNRGYSPSQSSISLHQCVCHHSASTGSSSSPAPPPACSLCAPMSPMSPLPAAAAPSSLHSNLPSRPSSIVGREIEVQRTISSLLSHRLVNIFGREKAGKTSVALLAAHFARERGRYEHGCYYVSMRGVGGMDGKAGESEEEEKAREARLVSHLVYVLGLEGRVIRSLRTLYQIIRDSELLLVFDDCSSSPAYSFLLQLLLATSRPRILCISDQDARHYFALDSRQSTASVEVAALSAAACLQLIRRLCTENGWAMRESEMQSFAGVCGYSAWQISMRMRRVAMKEREAGTGAGAASAAAVSGTSVLMLEEPREESVRGGEEWQDGNEAGDRPVASGPEQEEAAALQAGRRPMRVQDFVCVLDVDDMMRL